MKITRWNRKPITKPGVYSGIPLDVYHSAEICDGPSVSSSHLRRGWKSMAHFYDGWPGNADHEPWKPTRPMVLGSAAHHLLLGEDDFKTQYIGRPETYRDRKTAEVKPWNNNATACKDWNEAQAKAGKTVVTQAELKSIIAMARSLALEPLVIDGGLRGDVECSMMVKDKETGLWLKARPDVIPTQGGDYVDLKTADEVTTVALQKSIRSYGYHMQGGLLWEVCEQLGLPFETFLLMFVEKDRPHCVYPVPVSDDDLARGRLQCRSVLRKIAGCLVSGIWPGPFDGHLRPLGIALDERERIDNRLKQEGIG